jgi:hypothetical protein
MAKDDATFVALQVSLTKAIQKWMDDSADNDGDLWAAIGYVGNNTGHLMAKAAIAVLESSNDIQDFMAREGILKDEE